MNQDPLTSTLRASIRSATADSVGPTAPIRGGDDAATQGNVPPRFNQSETDMATDTSVNGAFVIDETDTWYRINSYDHLAPFFMALAGDSDLWAYLSSAGSLTAGRRDAEGAFLPYETVDKIHLRGEHTGPRTWIQIEDGVHTELWQPFAPRSVRPAGRRSVWKNLSGTRIRFRDEHASGRLTFQYEWFTATGLGLVRSARLEALQGPMHVKVLDGVLNLIPPGVGVELSNNMSCLTDAYKWNESAAGGRLGLFTIYAQIWDRAEPKESLTALAAWHAGAPVGAKTMLSARQVEHFCQTGQVGVESLTRGYRGAFLINFDAEVDRTGLEWYIVIDGPHSQVEAFELSRRLETGEGTVAEIVAARERNSAGLDELLARADAFQNSGDPMAAAHHRANVLFNIMRGGVFVDGTRFERDDLIAFVSQRSNASGSMMKENMANWPPYVERSQVLAAARDNWGPQSERLVLEYLPLTFSRRHGDPSRPWNKFSIRVRDAQGRRVVNHEGNWRDIFQNWEALLPSEPDYVGSMIAVFVNSMTVDGYNPYRIGRDGIDWEIEEPDNAWSHIGYWGDHQVIYLLKLLEAAQAREPGLLALFWDRAIFSFADVPYRLKRHAEQVAQPKETIVFDHAVHEQALERARRLGADGLLVCDEDDKPVLATLAEKLATILLAKAGSLVPGGGLWLHTQRPEWNDANNALVGNGLSVVTLAHLRRFLTFLAALPGADSPFAVSASTLEALIQFRSLVCATPLSVVEDDIGRREFLDAAGSILDAWRAEAYRGAAGRHPARAPLSLLPSLARDLLPLIDATLRHCKRVDGLYESYNLVDFSSRKATVGHLYPMLEGQVAVLSSGLLSLAESLNLLQALFDSPLFTAQHGSFLLYPDRPLPGFLERNRLDAETLQIPAVKAVLASGRTEILQTQSDGTVRFAPGLANRNDLEAVAADLGPGLPELVAAYERALNHREFTGRSGTMFGYEGLGCIYWHMVAKLLLAVQECVFEAADQNAPELEALCVFYRKVRDGLGYRRNPSAYGAFPTDPYSHTPAEGGAQQPGMTGQVKEEILSRWGELGLRVRDGRVHFTPVLLDAHEIPPDGALTFTWARVPYAFRHGARTKLRVLDEQGWRDCADLSFDPKHVKAVEADLCFPHR